MSRSGYCPNCQSTQSMQEALESGRIRFRCLVCGSSVEVGPEGGVTTPARPPTILCIDDDQLVLRITHDALSQCGFQTLIASDGPTGIALAKGERPDLILLDILMPDMSGFEVCRCLRADSDLADTPIILLTALDDPNVDLEGSRAGATLTMRKPFGPEVIVETIQQILGRKAGPAGG